MSKIFEGAKFLVPGTNFIISWKDKTLWEITEHGKVDWTNHVTNWEPFLNIVRSGCEDHEKLMLHFGYDNKTLVFFNFVLGGPLCVAADLVISNNSLKEDKKMDEEMNRKITPEERIEQLEEERVKLLMQIKNKEKYDEARKMGDELAIIMSALQDSGFSRDEAMRIFTTTITANLRG